MPYAIIDRGANNVLGEFDDRESAAQMLAELLEADDKLSAVLELVEANEQQPVGEVEYLSTQAAEQIRLFSR
ncbi:MAG TPA: hypothetical protein VFI37_08005 [Gaiellaceae bacterium]|nr:hypothetical protein [Gaiellaceae bacterium]